MRVYLGSDHAGFVLKSHLIEWLAKAGHDPVDCGPEADVRAGTITPGLAAQQLVAAFLPGRPDPGGD